MINNIAKYLFYILLGAILTLYLLPKKNIYFALEHQLEKYNIILSNETIQDNLITFGISKANLYFQNMDIASIKYIDFAIFGISNTIEISDVKIQDSLATFVPPNIKHIKISNNIFNPMIVDIKATGDMGDINGSIDIKQRLLRVELNATKQTRQKYSNSLNRYKTKHGTYRYEYRF